MMNFDTRIKGELAKAKRRARQGYTAFVYIADMRYAVRLNLETNKIEYCCGLNEWRGDILTALDAFHREERTRLASNNTEATQ